MKTTVDIADALNDLRQEGNREQVNEAMAHVGYCTAACAIAAVRLESMKKVASRNIWPTAWATFLVVGALLGVGAVSGSGELRGQQAGPPSAEARARSLVAEYYQLIDRMRVPGRRSPCTGASLDDCFGGDPECRHPHLRAILRGYLCTDEEVLSARDLLLERLDSLGRAMPQSDWIAGQSVYLAWKIGDLDRAETIAARCDATPWWCQALRGFVRHARLPGSGGLALDSAMANAPSETYAWVDPLDRPPPRLMPGASVSRPAPDRGLQCEWMDLGPVIAGTWADLGGFSGGLSHAPSRGSIPAEAKELLEEYQSVPCGENRAFEDRFWWLADPLWSLAGNERRDEHMVRNLRRRLRDEILLRDVEAETLRRAWSHQEMIAVGPPNSWEAGSVEYETWSQGSGWTPTSNPNGGGYPRRTILGYGESFVNGGYSFAPDLHRVRDPMGSKPEDWAVTWGEGIERMFAAETWYNVEDYQSAVLWRHGRLLAVAAAGLPMIVPSVDSVRVYLALGRPTDLSVEVFPGSLERTGIVRVQGAIVNATWMMSIEMMGEGWRARARHGAPAPVLHDGFGVSPPVLMGERFAEGSLPVLDAMLATTRITGAGSIGIYFEVYGAHAEETLRFTLSTAPAEEASVFTRVGRFLRLVSGPSDPVTIDWSEPADSSGTGWVSRYSSLDLSSVADGAYELTLTVARIDGTVASSSRIIHVDR